MWIAVFNPAQQQAHLIELTETEMPTEIYLVKAGMTMTEGMVAEWHIDDGDQVSMGDMLYSMETEKITLDVDAEATGTVRHLVAVGISCEPGQTVGFIYADGESIPDQVASSGSVAATPVPIEATPAIPLAAKPSDGNVAASPIARRIAREQGIDLSQLTGSGPGGRITEEDVNSHLARDPSDEHIPSSPAARRLARELGVDLAGITGTGPRGRVTQDDVEAAAANNSAPSSTPASATTASSETQIRPLSAMRKTIAKRMHESLQGSAQLTMDMDVNMDDAVKLREQLIEEWQSESVRPTYTDLVVRAVTKALSLHPDMNSAMTDDGVLLQGSIHVGLAVALEEGLVVPVIRNADKLDLKSLCAETNRISTAAREGGLGMDDYSGGTFTVSALGMFEVDSFTPILNSPESGILGVNRIREAVGWHGDQPVKQKRMNLSLTWDHRVLDGAPAAQFLLSVRSFLEAPYRLLI